MSPTLTSLAKTLWLWALERDITITAQHIPGVFNGIADTESRLERDRSDWMLSPEVFQKINQALGPLEVDLFASRLTHQLPRFFSWRPDPLAEAVDAFQQDWSEVKGFANPPWCLIGHVLNKIRSQEAQVVLVAPVWKSQAWYPVVLEMLMDYPRLIPPQEGLLRRGEERRVTEIIPVSRMACLRERYRDSCLSTEASELMLASWRTKSSQSYESLFGKWARWCAERGRNPISGPIADIANFLAHLHEAGYQSRSLNAYRSAISSVHDTVDGVEVGKHPMISRLLKGAYHSRPPLPRYTATWDVQVVLRYFEGLGPTSSLPLKPLTFKLVMLMALTRPSRSADLATLQVDRRHYKPEGVAFLPAALTKQSSQGRVLKEFFFPSFPHNTGLCPVATLRQYEAVTATLRPSDSSRLFVAIKKPHNPVASCTIARWLKETLRLAGIDVSIFSGHSVRGASTSAAAGAGVTMTDILQAADWSTESVFRRFYYRPSHDATYGRTVLSSTSASGET